MALGSRITVHGHCARSAQEISALIESGRFADIVDSPGNFVIVFGDATEDVIICSRSGIVGYYMTVGGGNGRAIHGPDVCTVIEKAGLRQAWDYGAVADYLVFTHPLGSTTMHPRVRRLPGGVVVHIADGSVREQPVPPPAPVSRRPSTPDEAVDVLLDAVGTDAPDQCAISMSGGLDSRLLLAALLALGRRPHLIISGTAGSFDREVAVAIGQRLDLPATVVSVTADHVVTTLPSIARMTNGLIPAGNWAGLVHLRSVPDSGLPVLLGFNGELARGYYAPQAGWRIPWVAGSLPRGSNAVLLGRHFGSPFAPGERRWLAPGLQDALAPGQVTRRLSAALDGPALDRAALDRPRRRGAFAAADRLFLEHYGPQKLGNDLAAIDPMVHWRVPMFAVRFVSSVRSLPLAWKLGDRFHRYAISRLCRRLLDSPEEGYGPRTSRRVPMRYWVRGPTQGSMPFFLDHSIFRSERLLGMLGEHREALADLVDPQLIDRLAVEQAQCPSRPQAAFSLLALAMWRDATAADPGSIG